MSAHKLTAGSGYTYLTRQVAASDATQRGRSGLDAYYSEKGESPGTWIGRGLAGVSDFRWASEQNLIPADRLMLGAEVTEAQMVALFGEGRHPNSEAIERALRSRGVSVSEQLEATRLGKPFLLFTEEPEFSRRLAVAYRELTAEQGIPRGTPLAEEVRAGIRTRIARAMFVETYHREPVDARELSGHLARISRQPTTAVAGYDLTFSPVKSVSTLWAIAPRDVGKIIEEAHHAAVADTLAWLEDTVAYTRRGAGGVQQVEVRGLIAASFTHRDTRAGDPDLHTHLAISNKVQAHDGTWLAVDGRPLFKNVVAASERYNTRLEALLSERLGVVFIERPHDDPGKRPIREIAGIDGRLPARWSSRRAAIDLRRATLSAAFQVDHGRPPTAKEAIALAQQATLETRAAKHFPRSHAEQRATWHAEALDVLGDEKALTRYVRDALTGTGVDAKDRERVNPTGTWVRATAASILVTVSAERAVWQVNHVRAEAERAARTAGIRLAYLDRAVADIVTEALSDRHSITLNPPEEVLEPAALRRSDGTSVYDCVGSQLYTTPAVLAAEERILAAAGRRGGRALTDTDVDVALVESAANRVELNPAQAQLVRTLATSGSRLQLALAPAGTGKTTAMRVLSRAWTATGGTVIGLAPSAAAAAVLREEIEVSTDTLAKLLFHLKRPDGFVPPRWMTGIGPGTLLIIDEAGMASTTDLEQAITHVLGRGGSVRLVGDDQQLAAIGAGGILRDISRERGAVTLSQVMRFTDPTTGAPNHAEGAASLALRDGDPAALAYYTDHRRLHVGDLTTVTTDAYTAWQADREAGRDAIMIAPTRDLVAELNQRARTDRLTTAEGPLGREVALANGQHASARDVIITRENDRRLAISATDWVKNGDRWTIRTVTEKGALQVLHHGTGLTVTLPAAYVATHVDLGYAVTVHGAQGITADTCHTVAAGIETRQLLYVAMTRGRHANHVYLTTAGTGEEHTTVTRDALLPPTAVEIMARILARDASPISSTSSITDLFNPIALLTRAAQLHTDALTAAAQNILGPGALVDLDATAGRLVHGIHDTPAWPTLRAHLALLAATGTPPEHALRAALADPRGLTAAHDPAAVLDWRLDPTRGENAPRSPLPWQTGVPAALLADPLWGRYLTHRARHLNARVAAVRAQARTWDPTSAPAWAVPLLDADRTLVENLALWRAAHDIGDTDLTPTGPPRFAAAEQRVQRMLDTQAAAVLGDPNAPGQRWAPLATSIEPRLLSDPYWPTLARRLDAASRAGIDITGLATTAGARGPLPDEHPAAALWWRLAAHLAPAATTATAHSANAGLRPGWTPVLTDLLGRRSAERVLADPGWPALVAAVTHAGHAGWTPEQALGTAHDLLTGGQDDDAPLRDHEYATALTWRIELLLSLEEDPPSPLHTPNHTTETSAAQAEPPAGEDGTDDIDPELTAPEDYQPNPPVDTAQVVAVDTAGPPRWSLNEFDAWLGQYEQPTTATVSPGPDVARVQRAHEVNALAADYYTGRYEGSWAAAHVRERLGTDLAGDERFTLGYAPAGWTGLSDHLRRLGVTDADILDAGLASTSAGGHTIDRFRDRLLFAIRDHDQQIIGWIGRRHPDKTDDDTAGPKYLNTGDTPAFTKGEHLYGLTETRDALAAGATPVLVEGPMDALAVTLAGTHPDTGAPLYVGVAPLGTSFTAAQADQLRPHIPGNGDPGIIVATDTDRAGQHAATRAYWRLTARGDNPRRTADLGAKDPAELLTARGPDALRGALEQSGPLVDAVVAERVAPYLDRLDIIGQVNASERAAHAIGALHPTHWTAGITTIRTFTGVLHEVAAHHVIEAGEVWIEERTTQEARRLAERPAETLVTQRAAATVPETAAPTGGAHTAQASATEPASIDGGPAGPVTAAVPSGDERQRHSDDTAAETGPVDPWADLAESIHPGISSQPNWERLAATLTRAHARGYDITAQLRRLAEQHPLPGLGTTQALEFRVIQAFPPAIPDGFDALPEATPSTPSPGSEPDAPSLGPARSAQER